MASVAECIGKLVAAKTISKAIGDEALSFYSRSQAEHGKIMGPASADAASALETSKMMRDKAIEHQRNIAAQVAGARNMERATLETASAGETRAEAAMAQLTKRTKITEKFRRFAEANPDSPAVAGNADYRFREVARQLYGKFGEALEPFKPRFAGNKDILNSAGHFVDELFGVSTGDQAAKDLATAHIAASQYGMDRAKRGGKIFNELEDWRLPQHWSSERVAQFKEAEYVKDHMAEIASGGLKLMDKETNKFATGDKYEEMLRKAYSDIKTEGGSATPFSKDRRTFQFQPGQVGADSWKRLQAKYGVGNEIVGALTRHVEGMSREIALTEQFGPNHAATVAAMIRLVKDDPEKDWHKLGMLNSVNTLQKTYDQVAGRGRATENETRARIFEGARNLATMANLRNLPITIIPSDSAMLTLASSYDGMSGFNVLRHVFDGTLSKDVARHLQLSAHSSMEYMTNSVRRYENELNVSGIIRKVSRQMVKATGADMWTRNGRLGFQVSYLNQIDGMRGKAFDALDPTFRDNFLKLYGFTANDWDKIRASPQFTASNGATYLDPEKIEPALSERLMMAIKERSSYAFHEPDARTTALTTATGPRGNLAAEVWQSAFQYKQFAVERMTTHLMRILYDPGAGGIDKRIGRGLAFTALSMAAGAVTIQAGQVISGKDPRDMTPANPKFWIEAFMRSGAGGMYGDLLDAAMQGQSGAITGMVAGPVIGGAADLVRLGVSPLRDEVEGKKLSFGGQASRMMHTWTPATWYTKLALDRLLLDKIQTLIDPNYRASFRRAEQNQTKAGSTGFFWGPGDTAPSRPPNIGSAIGQK